MSQIQSIPTPCLWYGRAPAVYARPKEYPAASFGLASFVWIQPETRTLPEVMPSVNFGLNYMLTSGPLSHGVSETMPSVNFGLNYMLTNGPVNRAVSDPLFHSFAISNFAVYTAVNETVSEVASSGFALKTFSTP